MANSNLGVREVPASTALGERIAAPRPDAFLSLSEIGKSFGATPAVRGLSMEVSQGEVVALLGPSGCGKTTTLNMIAGFLQPDAGSISLAGRVINRTPVEHRNIGIVFQKHALFPHMTVFDNVAYGLRRRKLKRQDIASHVMEKLSLVGLDHVASRRPAQLSGGQQQRVALARALVIKPTLLLLDEPLSSLDAHLRVEMRREIRRIVDAEGVTAVMVTHDQEEGLAIADRVAVLLDGTLLQLDTPTNLYQRPANRFVAGFVGHSVSFPGAVHSRHGEVVTVDVGAGRVGMRGIDRTGGLTVGDAVEAVVRPERIQVAGSEGLRDADSQNRWSGSVRSRAFLGPNVDLTLEAGPEVITFKVPWADAPQVGDTCALRWKVEDTHVFTAGSPC